MKLLALDIGGVCLTLHPEAAFTSLGTAPGQPVPPKINELYNDYTDGVIGTWQFTSGIQQAMAEKLPLPEIARRWNLFLGEEIPETTALLEALWNSGWHVVFFSDTQPLHIERLRDILSYSKRISDAVYSCDVGAQKPSPAMYQAFEERFGKPDLYLDDRLPNVQGGLARGWRSIQYSPKKARDIIRAL